MAKEEKKVGRPIITPAPWGSLYKCVGGQEQLAEKLGVSKSTVGKWAIGVHRVPTLVKKELAKLCKKHNIKEGEEVFS